MCLSVTLGESNFSGYHHFKIINNLLEDRKKVVHGLGDDLLLKIFLNLISKILYFLKMRPIFDGSVHNFDT